jgi:hypothetical protein
VAKDPRDAVVGLCARGMEAEGAGRAREARSPFEEVWETAADDSGWPRPRGSGGRCRRSR